MKQRNDDGRDAPHAPHDERLTKPMFVRRPAGGEASAEARAQPCDAKAWAGVTSTMWARLIPAPAALEEMVTAGRASQHAGAPPAVRATPIAAVGLQTPSASSRSQPPAPQRERALAPQPPAPVPVTRHSVQSPLFRAEALAAYQRGERAASVLRITNVSRWMMLGSLALLVLIGTGLTVFGHVEERSSARGVLRAPHGVQPVVARLGGTLREVLVQAGDEVAQGQVVARLDATPLRAELQEAEQRLSALAAQWTQTRAALERAHERSAALTRARLALLEQRQARQLARVGRRQARSLRLHAAELDGVIEGTAREETVEQVEGARDELLRLSDELSVLRLARAAEERDHEQQLTAGAERVQEAERRRDAVQLLLQQTELRAPMAGRIESLRAQPGQVVQPAEWIARVVRDDAPDTLVAFAPERDAAFLRAGAAALVQIDQLPVGEFGLARARVTRVADELADESELVAALGEEAPRGSFVRVELELDDGPESARVRPLLRAGTLVTTRIALRDRRLLAIVFEPARKWLEL